MFDEIHGDGVPWVFRNWELFQQAIRLVMWNLGTGARGTRRDIILDKGVDAWPSVLSLDQVQSAGLTKMSREWVVMFVPQDPQMEVINVRDVDAVV